MNGTIEDLLKKHFSRHDRFDVLRWLTHGHKTVTKSEEISILSLLAYTSIEADIPLTELQTTFLDHYGISKAEQLRSEDFENAIRFIMNFNPDAQDQPLPVKKAG